ncbi:MAG TPA: cyclopropane-fatty-acyl-phospholipid synthase family protein [Acidimicrobiia bacterium]|jgi:cyclopropane-fatty-acyl-phospholipid synthase|nr:cyclopropane-fatty-acyl-phospholipid synthase family protein [Acidimicrobiia bacterium]
MLLSPVLDRVVKTGTLTVVDAHGRVHRGGGVGGPSVTLRLHDPALHRRLVLQPGLAFGEAYMAGTLTVDEGTLYDALDLTLGNVAALADHPLARLARRRKDLTRRAHAYNPIGRAHRNVAHHYDLSLALYDLFLDRDRLYSCGYFLDPDDSLEVAQRNKMRHVAAKLRLSPGQKVLDIGSGWGGLALYLAELADVDVTGVTLSAEQHRVSTELARAAGLADRVRFQLCDYRQVTGTYDRIASVGMFEHVGPAHHRAFFAKVGELLVDDGVMLLHSIGRMSPPGYVNPWLTKYIFPGGSTPALSEVFRAVERTGLWVLDVEILRLHYIWTLRHWRERFAARRDEARGLYGERFCRMWEFYLVAAELAFHHFGHMVFQMQLAHRQDAVPVTRDHITDFERAEHPIRAG